MPVIALLDRSRGRARFHDLALRGLVVAVKDLDPVAVDDGPVTFVEIGDALRPWSDRERVRSEIILADAVAHCQRGAATCTDDEFWMIPEKEGNGEGAGQPRQYARDGLLRRRTSLDLSGDEMTDHFRVRLAFELPSLRNELVAERLEVFDDPVVHQGDGPDDVRVGVPNRRGSVRRPTRMCDAGSAMQRIGCQLPRKIVELPLGAPP